MDVGMSFIIPSAKSAF